MTSRRPNTANDAGPSRIPFASAEALLWGPEMKKQHAYLLTEMRALQKRHEEHNARIRTTETVTEAAEAATARIRDLEQQFAAIEAKLEDKVFEKWASGEITRLGVFVDTNKDVRQKQSEFATKVSHVSEKLDRCLRDNVGIEDVLRRLDVLEHGRREDTERIQGLEREFDRLRSLWQRDASCPMQSRTDVQSREEVRKELIPSRKSDIEISDLTIESDNEESLLPQVSTYEKIQVPQSPEVQEVNPLDFHGPSPPKGHSIMSARRRLLQRPSIHDAKLPQPMEEQNAQPSRDENPGPGLHHSSPPPTQLVFRRNWQSKPEVESEPESTPPAVPVPAAVPELLPAPAPQRQALGRSKANGPASEAPPTQLVERKPPGKRKQPDCGLQTQRQTRSQAKKNQAKEEELQTTTGADAAPETQSAQKTDPESPPCKKLKATSAEQRAGNKANTSGASQAASRGTKKIQNQCKVEEPSEQKPVVRAKSTSTTTRSRRTKAAASRKKNPTPAPPPPVSTSSRRQRRLIVKLHLGKGDQKDNTSLQGEISAS